jgi:hypothetical protein
LRGAPPRNGKSTNEMQSPGEGRDKRALQVGRQNH